MKSFLLGINLGVSSVLLIALYTKLTFWPQLILVTWTWVSYTWHLEQKIKEFSKK